MTDAATTDEANSGADPADGGCARDTACPNCGSDSFRFLVTKRGYDLVRCAECRLVRVRPMPSAEEIADIYRADAGYHDQMAADAGAEAWRAGNSRGKVQLVERFAEPGRILEVGCSAGHFLAAAAQAGWNSEGVELSPDTAAAARERTGRKVHVGTLESAELVAESFDVVTMWDVIEHMPRPREALARTWEILAPGGILAIETPNEEGLYPRLSLALAPLTGIWGHAEPPYHLVQFSKTTLTDMLDRSGFDILHIEQKGLPLSYTLSLASPKTFTLSKTGLYHVAMAPFALLGPKVGRGDAMKVIARKRREGARAS